MLAAARHRDVAVFLHQVEAGARGISAQAVILKFALWDIELQGFRWLVSSLLMGQRSRERTCAPVLRFGRSPSGIIATVRPFGSAPNPPSSTQWVGPE